MPTTLETVRALRARGNARLIALAAPTAAGDVADHLAHQLQPLLALLDGWEQAAQARAGLVPPLLDTDLDVFRDCLDALVTVTHAMKPLAGRGAVDNRQGGRRPSTRVVSDPLSTRRVKKDF